MSLSTLSLQAVQPKAGTPGVVQDSTPTAPAQGGPSSGSQWIAMLPVLVVLPLLFMQMRRQKKESDNRAGLKKGDVVVTNGGLIGELVEFDTREAKVKIAPGTTVRVVATTIAPFEPEAAKLTISADKAAADKK